MVTTLRLDRMVIAAQRAYNDAIRWVKSARPPRFNGWRLTRKVVQTCLIGSLLLLGLIGLVSPASFGGRGSRAAASVQWWGLAALVAVVVLWCFVKRDGIRAGASRLAEPLRRKLLQFDAYRPAVDALEAAPAAQQTRFALGWVWGPAAAVVVAAFFAASSAYFVVDAVLARFQVGWEQPVLAVVNLVLSVIVVRLVARRLSTWRLAFSIHRDVTGAYGS